MSPRLLALLKQVHPVRPYTGPMAPRDAGDLLSALITVGVHTIRFH